MIIKCTCKHEAQDKIHGKSKRVCNEIVSKDGSVKYRCTVCLTEHCNKG